MLDLTKPVQTRDGRSVRVLASDAKGKYPIVGLIATEDFESVATWTADGNLVAGNCGIEKDLINVPRQQIRFVTEWIDFEKNKECDMACVALHYIKPHLTEPFYRILREEREV